ncbi:MAG: hypothetical protein ACI9MS_001400 [Glaciecola sp.]|jgi:hypothetical protein
MSQELQEQGNLSEQQDAEFPFKQTVVGKIKHWRLRLGDRWAKLHWRLGLRERWAKLHTNQIIYVIALFLFIVVDGDMNAPNTMMWFIGILAFFGMARELWAIFLKVWESTFGRLILLVLYAAIANFTLAVAAQKVNIIITADPTQLYHTLGVTTLLVLPLWLMVVSVVGMIVIFGLMQILRLMLGLLILMRIIARTATPKEAFPKIFIVVRLILLFPVSMTVFNSLSWYGEQLNLPHTPGFGFSDRSANIVNKQVTEVGLGIIEKELQRENLDEEERQDLLTAKRNLLEKYDNGINENLAENAVVTKDEVLINEKNEELIGATNEEPNKVYFLDNLIASFVYNYETFEYSHCQKESDERVVYISENDILVVTKDNNAPTGYTFSTRSCVVAN